MEGHEAETKRFKPTSIKCNLSVRFLLTDVKQRWKDYGMLGGSGDDMRVSVGWTLER